MTIKKVDQKRLIISLLEDDMILFSLNDQVLNLNTKNLKKIVKKLLTVVREKCDFINEYNIILEIILVKKEFLIFVSLINNKRKKYKIKKFIGPFIFSFKNLDDLIFGVQRIFKYKQKVLFSTFITNNNINYLVIYPRGVLSYKIKYVLCDYGKYLGKGKILEQRLLESGKIIVDKNMLDVVNKYFK